MNLSIYYCSFCLSGKCCHCGWTWREVRCLSLQIPSFLLLNSCRYSWKCIHSTELGSVATFVRCDIRIQITISFLLNCLSIMVFKSPIITSCQRSSWWSLTLLVMNEATLTPSLNSLNQWWNFYLCGCRREINSKIIFVLNSRAIFRT